MLCFFGLVAGVTASVGQEAVVFNEPHLPDGLRAARAYAGRHGFVVSLPELFAARATAPFDNEVWQNWFTTLSEESVVPGPDGKPVVVLVHGGGILSHPSRIDHVFAPDGSGTTDDGLGRGAARLSSQEAAGLLDGRLPDGSQIPVYPFARLNAGVPHLPRRYAVVLDFAVARSSHDGYSSFADLERDPLFIARAGGSKAAAAYLERAQARRNTTAMGSWHPFGRINASEPQTRITFMSGNLDGVGSQGGASNPYQGYDSDYGIGGDANIMNRGRFIAVGTPSSVSSLGPILAAPPPSGPKGIQYRPELVHGPNLPAALRSARWRAASAFGNSAACPATPRGRLASLPDLLRARASAPFDNDIWSARLAANSDQSIVRDAVGAHLVVTVHGGGMLGASDRMEQAFRMDESSLTGQYAAKLSEAEATLLLEGSLPDGSKVPIYSYADFKAASSQQLPERYGVVLDYDSAKASPRGCVPLDSLRDDPWFIVNAGGVAAAGAYLDKLATRSSSCLGNWPPFSSVFWGEAQSRPLFLDTDGGVLGTSGMVNAASYIALLPTNETASLRHLPFGAAAGSSAQAVV